MKGIGNRQKRVVVPRRVHAPPKPAPPKKTDRRSRPERNAGERLQPPRRPGE
jgi:hypothetical protein